jgi:lysosomal acid lipase/cholesteryl ester hydrolase
MVPSLGKKLSVFIALAPAVYAGPLTTGFPFTALNRIEWSTWKRFFGVLDFIPLMRWAYNYCPAKIFVSPYPILTRNVAYKVGTVRIVSLSMSC